MDISKIIYLMLFINFCYPYNFRDILNKVDLDNLILQCDASPYVTCQFKKDREDSQYKIILVAKNGTKEKIILKAYSDRFHKIFFKIINQYTLPLKSMVYNTSDIYDIDNDIYPYKYIVGFYSDEINKFSYIRIFLEYRTNRLEYLDIIIDIKDIFKDYYKMNKFDDIYTLLPVYTMESALSLNLRNRKEVDAVLNAHSIQDISLDEIELIFSKINKLKYFKCTEDFCYYKNLKIYSKIKELGFKKPLYVVIKCRFNNTCLEYQQNFFTNHAILVYKDSLNNKFYVIDNNDENQQIHELFEFWSNLDKNDESILNIYSIN